jgi:hypothetical protein
VLSLWRVADKVTATLMRSFYEELETAVPADSPAVAGALRRAMLRTRVQYEHVHVGAVHAARKPILTVRRERPPDAPS